MQCRSPGSHRPCRLFQLLQNLEGPEGQKDKRQETIRADSGWQGSKLGGTTPVGLGLGMMGNFGFEFGFVYCAGLGPACFSISP